MQEWGKAFSADGLPKERGCQLKYPRCKRERLGDGWRQDRATVTAAEEHGSELPESQFSENQKPEISDRLPDFKYWPSILSFLFKNTADQTQHICGRGPTHSHQSATSTHRQQLLTPRHRSSLLPCPLEA